MIFAGAFLVYLLRTNGCTFLTNIKDFSGNKSMQKNKQNWYMSNLDTFFVQQCVCGTFNCLHSIFSDHQWLFNEYRLKYSISNPGHITKWYLGETMSIQTYPLAQALGRSI